LATRPLPSLTIAQLARGWLPLVTSGPLLGSARGRVLIKRNRVIANLVWVVLRKMFGNCYGEPATAKSAAHQNRAAPAMRPPAISLFVIYYNCRRQGRQSQPVTGLFAFTDNSVNIQAIMGNTKLVLVVETKNRCRTTLVLGKKIRLQNPERRQRRTRPGTSFGQARFNSADAICPSSAWPSHAKQITKRMSGRSSPPVLILTNATIKPLSVKSPARARCRKPSLHKARNQPSRHRQTQCLPPKNPTPPNGATSTTTIALLIMPVVPKLWLTATSFYCFPMQSAVLIQGRVCRQYLFYKVALSTLVRTLPVVDNSPQPPFAGSLLSVLFGIVKPFSWHDFSMLWLHLLRFRLYITGGHELFVFCCSFALISGWDSLICFGAASWNLIDASSNQSENT